MQPHDQDNKDSILQDGRFDAVEGEMVKPPQSRHGRGWSTVHVAPGERWGLEGRVYIKRQSGYFTRVYWRFFRKTPRLVCEHRALNYFRVHGIPVPEVVSFTETPSVTELIIREVPNALPLDQFLKGDRPDSEKDVAVSCLARLIARMHRLKWVHGALGNDHILVRDDGEVVLIDLEKTHWDPLRIRRDLARFWRRTDGFDESRRKLFVETYQDCMGR